MDYHKIDEPLRVREYGRNIQIMTERMLAEPDSRRQAQMAHEIIRVMNTIAPPTKDLVDQKRKLWDNLFRISDYRLPTSIIPFRPPVPLRSVPPAHIPYQNYRSKYKPYGRNVELLVQKALAMPDSPERDRFILQIAQIMRTFLHNYSSGVTSDKVIFDHLADLSGGKIRLSEEEISLRHTAKQHSPNPHPQQQHQTGHQIQRKKQNPHQGSQQQNRPYQQNRDNQQQNRHQQPPRHQNNGNPNNPQQDRNQNQDLYRDKKRHYK
jgi:hypothetical protein